MNENQNDRVKLSVMGISYSPMQSGAFAMLLAQEDGPYKIPIVIGAPEAQSIAIKLENISTPRPMTHDLFCSFAQAFGVMMTEVFIYKFEDGIFSSEIKFTDGEREVTIDARTSDAVAIAVRTGAPIYTTREILDLAGTIFTNNDSAPADDAQPADEGGADDLQSLSVEELRERMEKYIEEENYEEAARISAIIKSKE